MDWKKDPFFFFSLQKGQFAVTAVSFCITNLLGDTSKDLPKPHLNPISLLFFYSQLYSDAVASKCVSSILTTKKFLCTANLI
jgi:hypothetical protein